MRDTNLIPATRVRSGERPVKGPPVAVPLSPVRAILRDNVVENTARQQGDDTAEEIIPRQTRKIDEFKR